MCGGQHSHELQGNSVVHGSECEAYNDHRHSLFVFRKFPYSPSGLGNGSDNGGDGVGGGGKNQDHDNSWYCYSAFKESTHRVDD
jgi:hypothetical protein